MSLHLFAFILLVINAGMAIGQVHTRFQVTGLGQHNIELVATESRTAETGISSDPSSGPAHLSTVPNPFTAILKNNTNKAIVGLSIEWNVKSIDGTRTKCYEIAVAPHAIAASLFRLPQMASAAIVDRGGHYPISLLKASSRDQDPRIQTAARLAAQPLASASDVEVLLDAVILDDGTALGPDTSGLMANFQSMIDAEQDLKGEINSLRCRGASNSELFDLISTLREQYASYSQSDQGQAYGYYKGQYAAELLSIRRAAGDESAIGDVYEHFHKQPFKLQRR